MPDHRDASRRLPPCPGSPNCVCSDAVDARHRVAPLCLALPPDNAWTEAVAAARALPGTRVVKVTGSYLHAEWRSRLFGFVDDLELELRPDRGLIAVRSASRTGHYDFGVNRRRVEKLRAILRRQGVVE